MSKIVILGGYGHVGRAAATYLAPRLPGRVLLAGRNLARARSCAEEVGHGAAGVRLDSSDPDADLSEIGVLLDCAGAPSVELARRSLSLGVHYVDVSADIDRLLALERLGSVAEAAGSTGVLGVGLAPGATNLLAAHVVRGLRSRPERVDTLVSLGTGDAHGPAAIEWSLSALAAGNGFRTRTSFELPDRSRPVPAFSFDFPEARILPRTLGVPDTRSWLALDPAVVVTLTALSARMGVGRMLRHDGLRSAVARALARTAFGPDRWVVAARAAGQQATLTGHGEARATGLLAAQVGRRLLERPMKRGVFHVEQLFDPRELLEQLAGEVSTFRLTLPARS